MADPRHLLPVWRTRNPPGRRWRSETERSWRQDPALTGTVSATLGTDLRLLADSDELGGVFVSGEGSVFTLEYANIRLSGDTSCFDTKLAAQPWTITPL